MLSLSGYILLAALQIDGRLDEAHWKTAEKLDGFVQIRPGDNAPPSRETTVLLASDANALYIGIRAIDDPSKVRATVARRDDVLADDYVTLYLDTFDDHRRAYVLIFNPLGIQQDGIYTEGRGIDYSADLVLDSKGVLTEDGYTIEAALPFASIRHRSGADRKWGVHVERRIQHLDEDVSWKPRVRGNANLLAQAGAIGSFHDVASGRMIEVIPGMTVAEDSRDPSVTMKLALASDLVVDATVNPDFAQIEADELVSSANQRFPIFFEEKRPFFLEGIDVFQTPLNAMHTRTVVEPEYATKVSGKRGKTTFAALLADDNASVGVIRLKRDIGTESFLGAIATSRDDNRVAGVDGRFTLDANTTAAFQLVSTFSDRGNGFGFFAQWKRSGRHFSVTFEGEGRTPDYRANLGFTAQTDTNRWSVNTRYDSEPRPHAPLLLSWSAINTVLVQWDWDGRIKYAYVYPRVELNFRRQTKLSVFFYRDYLRLFEEEFGTKFVGEPERSTVFTGTMVTIAAAPSKRVSLSLTVDRAWDTFDYDVPSFTNPGTGRSLSITGRLELQPLDAMRVTLDYARNRFVRYDTGRVAFDEKLYSTQATYQFTSFIFARARVDYESLLSRTRSQFLLGWTPSPGTSLYAGYTDDLERTVFVKASYLVRRAW
ncbi:MAG TPA: DUF5916 domain-containing protein [Thermoanaerobaculia bacterium]|jgi:hypothetical protein|nr:DUF5916 domain-containing protein [Thermoanaerobaculia bacterium]